MGSLGYHRRRRLDETPKETWQGDRATLTNPVLERRGSGLGHVRGDGQRPVYHLIDPRKPPPHELAPSTCRRHSGHEGRTASQLKIQ